MNAIEPAENAVTLTARNLRGLAHPIRVRILGLLRSDGPATATGLARRLGLNSGATSYHLRQLAEHGFAVEDAERGSGRERWWKAAHWSTRMDPSTLLDGEEGELGAAYLHSVVQLYAERMTHAVDAAPTLPEEWRQIVGFSDHLLRLTAEEHRQLNRELHDTILKFRSAVDDSEPTPDDSARVVVQFQLFPVSEDLAAEEER